MQLDVDNAREAFEQSTDFTVGLEEEFAILDPGTLDLVAALRGSPRRGGAGSRARARSIAGELISSEIEIRSGRGRRSAPARPPRQRDRRRALFALAAERGARARRDGHPPVGGLPRAADHRHRALPPGRGRSQVRGVAQQHVLAARARGDPRRRPRRRGLRPPAPGPAAAARGLGKLAFPRRPRLWAAQRAHADLHQELPALRRPRRVRRLGRVRRLHRVPASHADRSSSTPRCGGRCGRTSRSGRWRCGSATRSRPRPSPKPWRR